MIANVLTTRPVEDILLVEREYSVAPHAGFLDKREAGLLRAGPSTKRDLGRIGLRNVE
jgi:hypothetical protein